MSLVGKWFGFERQEVFEEGVAACVRGDFEQAADAFESCLEDKPDFEAARRYLNQSYAALASAALSRNEDSAAAAWLEKGILLNPSFPDLHLAAAKAYRRLRRPANAKRHLKEALELNPNYTEAIAFEGASLYESGMHEVGLQQIEEACHRDPSLDPEPLSKARDLHQSGESSKAAEELFAVSRRIDESAIQRDLGDNLVRGGLFSEAVAPYERAVELAPTYADLRCRLGAVYYQIGYLERAEENLRRALEINPCYAEAFARLFLVLRDQKMETDARHALAKALDLDEGIAYEVLGPENPTNFSLR